MPDTTSTTVGMSRSRVAACRGDPTGDLRSVAGQSMEELADANELRIPGDQSRLVELLVDRGCLLGVRGRTIQPVQERECPCKPEMLHHQIALQSGVVRICGG